VIKAVRLQSLPTRTGTLALTLVGCWAIMAVDTMEMISVSTSLMEVYVQMHRLQWMSVSIIGILLP